MTNQMLKFKKVESGTYTTETSIGSLGISKGSDNKWHIAFPDGKKSYRSSYEGAKDWAEKYIERIEKTEPKVAKKETKATKSLEAQKTPTLAQKLKSNNSYIVGCDFTGCINSGKSATILHYPVNNISYYLVGTEGDVLDTYIYKNPFKIKAILLKGQLITEYKCPSGGIIKVFNSFKDAEKAYKELNQKTVDSNHQDRLKIAEAKTVIKNSNGQLTPEVFAAYTELGDYGLI